MDPALGLKCAVVADDEGEMIAKIGLETGDTDAAALFGAHQGVIFMYLQRSGNVNFSGAIVNVCIRTGREDWFVFPVTTGYYLAVLGERGQCAAKVRAAISMCIPQLQKEILAD